MDAEKLLKETMKKGETSLDERESKQVLKEYGVPVISETVAINEDEAVKAAGKIGFPVVLKGLGRKLLHKTEHGMVYLNLADSGKIRSAAQSITKKAGDELEGFLVQPQIKGKREFVAGLFRDEQFGPVVLFGLGGVFTEALSDVTFRLAPLTETDAGEMLDEIKAKPLLENFRGEKAVDRDQLIRTLMGISRIGVEHPEISEIDINPLLITPDGKVCAVDALVVINKGTIQNEFSPPVDPAAIRSLFYPESIVFIGASAKLGKWGHTLFIITVHGGYKGEIYLVNPKNDLIAGRKVYRSVAEIPHKVDLAVVTIPAEMIIDLIPQLKEKGIKSMLLITSGFGETGEKGKEIEKNLAIKARESGILIMGPNPKGQCNPHINLYCTATHVLPRPGSVSIVSQSGNMGAQLLAFAEQQGIGIRAYCGSGNEAVVTVEDYMEGFEEDNLTQTIMLYIESVKNGRRFFESARRLGRQKPIVLLKGGQSKSGNKAALSHTGALTIDSRVFNAMCRQTGIVKVERPMDLLDLSAAFSSLPLPKGNRTAIITLGGGWGVVTADLCAEYGLAVPDLTDELSGAIDKMLPSFWSRSNPIDLVGINDESILIAITEELLKWNGCDAVIILGILGFKIVQERRMHSILNVDPTYSPAYLESACKRSAEFEERYVENIAKFMEKYNKPVFGVSFLKGHKDQIVYGVNDCKYKGIFYQTPEQAVKALAKMYQYCRFIDR